MCTSQQHQKDLKLIVTTRMDKRVQVNPPPVLVLLSSYCLLFPHLCHMQILLLSRHDLEKSREQWLWQTTVKINISVFLLLNAVGMYLNTGHSMMNKAYAIKMSSL